MNPNSLVALAKALVAQKMRHATALANAAVLAEERFAILGVSREQYKRPDRHKKMADARAMVAAYLRAHGFSFPIIAKSIGLTNHTSAMAAVDRFFAAPGRSALNEMFDTMSRNAAMPALEQADEAP